MIEIDFDKSDSRPTPSGGAAASAAASDPQSQVAHRAMKMKGLPFSVTKQDIVTFFDGYNLIESSVKIGKMADGKLTGEAAVLFDSSDDCGAAHSKRNQ